MQFSDTTNHTGILQQIEYWCNMDYGDITDDDDFRKRMIARVNLAFDMLMPTLLSHSNFMRWDDLNHTDQPIGHIDINSGQNDYEVKEDDNSLEILNFTRLRFLNSAAAVNYSDLEKMTVDDDRATRALAPSAEDSGTPTHYLEKGNQIFLYPNPNYNATNGLQLFFEREQVRFVEGDTIKEPGIPSIFHELLALYPAHDWLSINKSDNQSLLARIEGRIAKKESALGVIIAKRNKTRGKMKVSVPQTR